MFEYKIVGPGFEYTLEAEDWTPVGQSTAIAFFRDGKNVGTFFAPLWYVVVTRGPATTEHEPPLDED